MLHSGLEIKVGSISAGRQLPTWCFVFIEPFRSWKTCRVYIKQPIHLAYIHRRKVESQQNPLLLASNFMAVQAKFELESKLHEA